MTTIMSMISRRSDNVIVYLLIALYLIISSVALYLEMWFVLALPFILGIILFSFFRPKYLFYAIVFMTPLSLNLEEVGMGTISFYLPTEPLLFGFSALLMLAHMYRAIFPWEIVSHPISRALYLYIGWMLLTSITSVDPVVSLKFLISRLWFIIPMYFAGATLFLRLKNARRFLLLYLIPFFGVVLYTLMRHSVLGFEEDPAHSVMEPFYRDHTQYGAVVAFFVPIAAGLFLDGKSNPIQRLVTGIFLAVLLFALVYTYSRAAWLSVFFAFVLWVIVQSKVQLKVIVAGGMILLLGMILSYDRIMVELRKNKTDSSENLVENVESITNISTDASNLERINRWNSVFAMTAEKPIFGFGPGTYMFEYAPYQNARDLTIISTNFGDVGNAHSEYLGPLAESGIPGMLSVLVLVFFVFYTAYNAYNRLPPGRTRHLLLFSALALVTYFTHGLLNNYLDSDKASVPVFGTMAIIAAIDVISRKGKNTK